MTDKYSHTIAGAGALKRTGDSNCNDICLYVNMRGVISGKSLLTNMFHFT